MDNDVAGALGEIVCDAKQAVENYERNDVDTVLAILDEIIQTCEETQEYLGDNNEDS